MSSTEERLSHLEHECISLRRRVRSLQGALGGVGVLALSALLLGDAVGQPQPPAAPPVDWDALDTESVLPPIAEVIRARRFEVVGKDERKFVAAMGTTPEGHGFVETWTASDKRTMRAGSSSPDGDGDLTLFDGADNMLMHAGAAQHAGGELRIGGKPGRIAAHLGADPKGDGELRLTNSGGFDFARIGTDQTSSGMVSILDEDGHRLASLTKSDRGAAHFELFNEIGSRLFDLTIDHARSATLMVGNAEGLVINTWPPTGPVEDRGDLPPAPPHLSGDAEGTPAAPAPAPAAPTAP